MKPQTKIILCMLEAIIALCFSFIAAFSLYGFIPELFNPLLGACELIGAGVLCSDLTIRACEGVGFSW